MSRFKIFVAFSMVVVAWYLLSPAVKAQNVSAKPTEWPLLSDDFRENVPQRWNAYGDGAVIGTLDGRPALQTQGNSQVFWGSPSDHSKMYQDVTVEGDLSVERSNASSGFMVRASKQGGENDWQGYWASIRLLDVGYAVVQLYRFPGFVLLQEARVRGSVLPGQLVPLKITCKGPHLWVWANDMRTPAITEFDDLHVAAGFVGLKSENNKTYLRSLMVTPATKTPRTPYVGNWAWVKGAVFITSESVNSYQMWEQYHPDVIDRELSFARASGLNTVQAYLDFLNWQKDKQVYLNHIEDFLQRAQKHELKVTFIFFDDVGNIEPPHLAPYHDPVPGIHNSQMQGCPGREIVDQHYEQYRDHLKDYVQAIVKSHKNDPRIIFWQTYNEPSHVTTLPLLADSYRWIKETGSTIPVTATGGGAFYGSYYSDFPSFHSYLDPKAPYSQSMVLGDGGPEHICTETLDRPSVDVPKLVDYFSARKTGWVIWELMIGRDNCRFPWGSPPGAEEPKTPFHGLLYPDGHPWSQEDIRKIRGKT